jgi:hypothetical protein
MATTTIPTTRLPQLSRLQSIGIGAAAVGLVLLLASYFLAGPAAFFHAYLFAYYFVFALPLGCLAALMVHHLMGGGWGVTVRRMLEAATLTIPIFGLLAIPIILAMYDGTARALGLPHSIYEWAVPAVITPGSPEFDPLTAHKVPWLSPLWVTARLVIFFVIWSGLAWLLRSLSLQQDRSPSRELKDRMARISGFGIALFVVSVTFFAFDISMSLDPHWFSTIYGAHYIVNAALIALNFCILVLTMIRRSPVMAEYVPTKPIHDLGKLVFAFTVLWTYMSFGQFVIIWAGDVAEFTPWYYDRINGGWLYPILFLMAFQFFFPFFILLYRTNKRNLSRLAWMAAWILVMRFIDMSWIMLPYFHETVGEAVATWSNIVAPIGLSGIFLALFAWNLQKVPLLPGNDPEMSALYLAQHHEHHADATAEGGHH